MDQLKRYILSHKLQAILTLVLIPLIFLGLYLVLQQTVFKPKAGGGVTHDLKISLVSGAKSELAPSETTSIVVTSDLGTENILGFDILLNYDSNQFEVTEVLPGQIFNTAQGGKGLVTVKRHENGEIKLSWAAYNSPLKPYITDMASSYGSNPSNVELLKVKVKANANSSGGSSISFGEDSKNIIVTVEGGGNKANIVNPRSIDFDIASQAEGTSTPTLTPTPTLQPETDPSKPIVSAACVGGSPTLNISWRGTVGRGSDADEANRGKNGFYVDLSISSGFDFVYNKFVETTQTSASTTAPSGFVLANAGRSDTGSPLSLSAGHGYFVRVYNGTHSPVSERVAIPACS